MKSLPLPACWGGMWRAASSGSLRNSQTTCNVRINTWHLQNDIFRFITNVSFGYDLVPRHLRPQEAQCSCLQQHGGAILLEHFLFSGLSHSSHTRQCAHWPAAFQITQCFFFIIIFNVYFHIYLHGALCKSHLYKQMLVFFKETLGFHKQYNSIKWQWKYWSVLDLQMLRFYQSAKYREQ